MKRYEDLKDNMHVTKDNKRDRTNDNIKTRVYKNWQTLELEQITDLKEFSKNYAEKIIDYCEKDKDEKIS